MRLFAVRRHLVLAFVVANLQVGRPLNRGSCARN